jgi:hypothetical protein
VNHPRSSEEQKRRLRRLALFLRGIQRIDAAWHARLARRSEDSEPPSDRPYARDPVVRRRDAELWRAFNRIRLHAPDLLRTARAQLLELPDDVDPHWAGTVDVLGRALSQLGFLHQEWIGHRELMDPADRPGTDAFAEMIAERNAEGRLEIRVWAEHGHVLQAIHTSACPEPSSQRARPTRADWLETSPRHLAGQGDARYVIRSLRASGWAAWADLDRPSVTLTSRDRRHTVLLEPEPHGLKPWWLIQGSGENGAWSAEFTVHTPVEIIAALTDSLDRPAHQLDDRDVWPVFTAAGWAYVRDDDLDTEIARHSLRTLRVSRWTASTTDRFFWTVEATFPDPGLGADIVWRASLDDTTPRHLLHSLAHTLTSDAPVLRPMLDVPHTHLVNQAALTPQGTATARDLEHRLYAPLSSLASRRSRAQTPASEPPATPSPSVAPSVRTA